MITSVVQPSSSPLKPLPLAKYSFGVGDRFARQARPQLRACMMLADQGVEVVPVWNKSNREHKIIGSSPASVRAAAQSAVTALSWTKDFHVDADHITLETVGAFIESSDYYTIDVASSIGQPSSPAEVDSFITRHPELTSTRKLDGVAAPIPLSKPALIQIVSKYLAAVKEAGRIYQRIQAARGTRPFITEVSMDETDAPQTPAELLVILAALADESIPLQTVAPKFSGRFNKGVDYAGSPTQFEAEFRSDLAVVAHAIVTYGLPSGLKLSIHSGSDKFCIYPAVRSALRDFGAGVHVKTAGTTWLEELIGLAEAGGEGLALAKEIYAKAYDHHEELCAPYASVIDINAAELPSPSIVGAWASEQYENALRHDQKCAQYNPSLRQLLHVGYKVAAQLGTRYLDALAACEPSISRNVTANLYERHLKPIFLGENQA